MITKAAKMTLHCPIGHVEGFGQALDPNGVFPQVLPDPEGTLSQPFPAPNIVVDAITTLIHTPM
jgi:hypothetical protein